MINPILTKIIKIFTILLCFILGYYLFTYTFSFLFPIGLAVLIALSIEPGVIILEKKLKFPRPLASIAILLLFVFLLLGSLFLIITEIYEGIAYLAELLPEQLEKFGMIIEHYFHTAILPFYETVLGFFNRLADADQLLIQENLSGLFSYFSSVLGAFFQNLMFSIPIALALVPESLTAIIFIFLASLLLSSDLPRVKQLINHYIPARANFKIMDVIHYLKEAAAGFIRAQLILVAVSFHLIFFGLLIMKVEHALTISLFMIVIDLIPYIGTGLLFIPWIIYSFLTADYFLTIGLAIIYMVVILVRQLIEPKVLAVNIGIHPLVWLIAVFIGYKIFGLPGLLLAPFAIVFLKGLYYAGVFRWLLRYIAG